MSKPGEGESMTLGEAAAYARGRADGAAAMREAAAKVCEDERPDVTAASSLITQGRAAGMTMAAMHILALPLPGEAGDE